MRYMRFRMIFQIVFLFFAMVALLLPATHVSADSFKDNQQRVNATKCNALADEAEVPNSIEMAAEEGVEVTKIEMELIDLINDEREKHNLNWLSLNDQLFQAARNLSTSLVSMNASSDKNNDASPVGAWTEKVSDDENIATVIIATAKAGAQDVFEDLMNNDQQRAALLNASYCEVGIGYVVDKRRNHVHYWTLNLLGTQRCVSEGSQVDLKAEFDSNKISGLRNQSSDICIYLRARYNQISRNLKMAEIALKVNDAMGSFGGNTSVRKKLLRRIKTLKRQRNNLRRLMAKYC